MVGKQLIKFLHLSELHDSSQALKQHISIISRISSIVHTASNIYLYIYIIPKRVNTVT